MSSTDKKTLTGELIPAKPESNIIRMSAGSIDEQYIAAYLENPKSKLNALRIASEESGIECHITRSRAYDIHKRLQHRIDAGLSERINDGAVLGYSILTKLAMTSDNDAVRAGCASKLIEYAGKNVPQLSSQPKNRDNIKEQIEQTKARILSITGKKPL